MPRTRLALAAVLALACAPGCFVDEIDKSMSQYEKNAPKSAPAGRAAGDGSARTADASARAGGGTPGAASGAAAAARSWWETAKTLGSEPMDETIVSCAIGGRVEFQRRDDCLARGGQPR